MDQKDNPEKMVDLDPLDLQDLKDMGEEMVVQDLAVQLVPLAPLDHQEEADLELDQ